MKLKVKNLEEKMIYLTIFLQILFVYESFVLELKWSKEFIVFFMLFYSFIVWFYYYAIKGRRSSRKKVLFLLCLFLLKTVSSIVYQDFYPDNIVFYVIVLTSFFISESFPLRKYLSQYVNVMLFYSIYSLIITYIVHPMVMNLGLSSLLPNYTNSIGIKVIDYIFTYVTAFFGFMRNRGPFREAGVYSIFLLIAIIISLFFDRINIKNRKIKLFIFITTLLTTVSTSGIIPLIIILCTYLFSNKINLKKKVMIIISGIIFIIITPQLSEYILISISSRFDSSNIAYQGSTLVRIEGPINCIKTNLIYPLSMLIGRSFVSGLLYIQNSLNTVSKTDVTGTNFIFLMALGWPMGIYILTRIYMFFKQNIKSTIKAIIVCISFLFALNSQALLYNTILWCLYFYYA